MAKKKKSNAKKQSLKATQTRGAKNLEKKEQQKEIAQPKKTGWLGFVKKSESKPTVVHSSAEQETPLKPRAVKLVEVPNWIKMPADVMSQVEKHAYGILDAEVGGMLFGRIENEQVNIIGFVPARNAAVDQISLTFTHEVWEDILAEGNKLFPGSQIVGWFHTHPNFGLFLSEYDSFIQRNFFASHRQLALVIDPISGHLGWFANGANDSIVTLGVAETLSGPAKPQERESLQLATSRREKTLSSRTVIIFGSTALVAGLIGFGIASANVPPDLRSQYNSLSQEIFNAESGGGAFSYLVQSGDTWASVAKTFYGVTGGLDILKTNNPEIAGKELVAGQELTIFGPFNLRLLLGYSPPLEPSPSPTDVSPSPTKQAPSPTKSASPSKNPFPGPPQPAP